MLDTRWLILLGSILLPMCSALMLNESKTYALQVPDNGFFTFIICGNDTEMTKICYDGKAKNNEHHSCQNKDFCGIQAIKIPGNDFVLVSFGGGSGHLNETCAKLRVNKHKQVALNGVQKVTDGTCTWNATDDGKLLVDVTLSKDFTVEVENAVLYQEVKTQKAGLLAGHLDWIFPVGIVMGILIVGSTAAVLIFCLCCKKKKQPKVGKQPSLATIPPEKLMAKEGSVKSKEKSIKCVGPTTLLVKEQSSC
uniref:Uncharacterized protein n=1 Tax=Panagrolaimus sp. JU765 TaxID=591449 RepID=A0AC34PXQ8_9BILA